MAFITHFDALEHVDIVGCMVELRWGGGRLSFEAKDVCVCILEIDNIRWSGAAV